VTRNRWFAVPLWRAIVLGALSAFGPLSIDMYLPALPRMAAGLRIGAASAQLSIAACLLGLAVGQLPLGSLSDVLGRRRPILAGLVVFALTSFLLATSGAIAEIVALRLLQGLSAAAAIAIARAVVRDLYSGVAMIRFTAVLMVVSGLGPVLAPVIGAQLLLLTSWRGIFAVLGLVGGAIFLMVLFGMDETLPRERRVPGSIRGALRTYGRLLADREFMRFALPQGFVATAMFAYISGSPFVVQDLYHASPEVFSVIFATNGLGIILFSQTTGRLAGRIEPVRLYAAGVLVAALAGLAVLGAVLAKAPLVFLLVPLFFAVASVGSVGSAGAALAMAHYRDAAGSASALIGLMTFVFGAFFGPLTGAGSLSALPMGILMAGFDVGAALSYALFTLRRGSRGTRAPSLASGGDG
jgi:DHA1 family bicyclomycin/chloramphenicol resistance-like MFS transporter